MEKIFFILSFLLYFVAPGKFSSVYCWGLLLLFIIEAVYVYIKDYHNEKIGFNVLFTIAFFLVIYLYPIFIYPFFPDFQILSIPIFNYDVITKCTALANLSFSCYCLGYLYVVGSDKDKEQSNCEEKHFTFREVLTHGQLYLVMLFCAFLFALFIATGGVTYFSNLYTGNDVAEAGGIMGFVWVLFQTFILLLLLANLSCNSILAYIFVFFTVAILLMVGTRTLPMNLLVVLFCFICKKYDFSLKKIGLIGLTFCGLFGMVGIIRGGGTAMDAAGGDAIAEKFRSVMDFLVPNRDLYAIYDYVQENGCTYGVSSLGYLLSVIPFSQSVFIGLSGIPEYMLRSERLTTFWEFGDKPDAWGLGTNIVGDVYLSFGFVGVVVLFLFLGYLIAKSRSLMFRGSLCGFLLYMTMLSSVIFMCRGSYFYSLKNIVWIFAAVYFVKLLYKPVEYIDKENKLIIK